MAASSVGRVFRVSRLWTKGGRENYCLLKMFSHIEQQFVVQHEALDRSLCNFSLASKKYDINCSVFSAEFTRHPYVSICIIAEWILLR